LIVFPIGATLVAFAFCFATWRAAPADDTALRVWSVALAQFGVASAALAWGTGAGWTPLVYRVFYLFGAVLNVAWLALGTVWLLAPRRAALASNVLFIAGAGVASALVMTTDLVPGSVRALAASSLPAPRDVMGSAPRALARYFSIGGSIVVLGGLLWSVLRRRHVSGLALLALGVVMAGVASELGRAGHVAPFSGGLAAGIAVMYAGFLRTRS
jgi:hypothetical protein